MWTRAAPRPSERSTPLSTMASLAKGNPEMSFMLLTGLNLSKELAPKEPAQRQLASQPVSPGTGTRSYGLPRAWRQIATAAFCTFSLSFWTMTDRAAAQTPVQPAPIQIVALGDSLTAGYGLPDKDGFVPRLQAALAAKGAAAAVVNAGVSGDTASDGLARLDWSVPERTDAVIVELGANDMLRGIKPGITR